MSKANEVFEKVSEIHRTTTEIVAPPEMAEAKTAEDVSSSMAAALSAQMNREIYSSLLYYAMGAHFGKLNLEGIESWFYKAAAEEMNHARKFNEYILDREGTSNFGSVETPSYTPGSATAMFEQVLAHEKTVTENIKNLFSIARTINDYQTEELLHWFLKEQVEEEKKASVIVAQFQQFGDTGAALALMDERLGK